MLKVLIWHLPTCRTLSFVGCHCTAVAALMHGRVYEWKKRFLTAMCLHPVSEPPGRRKVLILCFLHVSASVCCGHEQQLIVFLWCQVGPPASACTVHSETTLFFVNVKGAIEPHLQQEAKTQWGFSRRL